MDPEANKYTDEEIKLVLNRTLEGADATKIAQEINHLFHFHHRVFSNGDVANIIQHYTKTTGGH